MCEMYGGGSNEFPASCMFVFYVKCHGFYLFVLEIHSQVALLLGQQHFQLVFLPFRCLNRPILLFLYYYYCYNHYKLAWRSGLPSLFIFT